MAKNEHINVLIAAGGTGGHLFPALAVAGQLEKIAGSSVSFDFVGTGNRIEADKVPALGYRFHPMPIKPFAGLFYLQSYMLPLNILRSTSLCRRLIRERHTGVVICTGAYISYPAGRAAAKSGVPLVLMESNVNPGKTIKMLASKASMIVTSFEETASYFDADTAKKVVKLGNPVRGDILARPGREESLKKFNLDPGKKTLLIFGGSLGARSVNHAAESIVTSDAVHDWQVIWQTGKNYTPGFEPPPNVHVSKFIDDMAAAYSAADFVICRSGATTVAELCAAGKPSLLVPYPSASNNEQEANARVLEESGAAVMLKDSEAPAKALSIFTELAGNAEMLSAMGRQASELAEPDAALKTAEAIIELVSK